MKPSSAKPTAAYATDAYPGALATILLLSSVQRTYFLKTAYNEVTKEVINSLIGYLTQLGGKSLSSKSRRQNAFKTSWKEKEFKLIARCHVQNTVEYLNFLGDNISREQLRIVIADIADYVEYLDPNEDRSFTILSTNTLPSAVQFDSAKRLFYNHQIREQNRNNYATDLLTLYAIRLSLENRIRGLLGIDYARTNRKYIGLASLIKIAKNLKTVEYSDGTNWIEIEWVTNWLNHHMHRHLRPYPWIIHQALEVLKPFLNPKEALVKSNKKIYSFYSATYVQNEQAMQNEIVSNLKALYPDIEIYWLGKREIVTSE